LVGLTTIGSFPQIKETFKENLLNYIELQYSLSFNPLTDGEFRADMISYFATFIPGLMVKDGKPTIVGCIKKPDNPKEFQKVKDAKEALSLLRKYNSDLRLKVAVTGPITLGFTCAINGLSHYSSIMDMKLYEDLAEALIPLLLELHNIGCILQVDEPGISAGYLPYTHSIRILSHMLEKLPSDEVFLHICGELNPKLCNLLLQLPTVSILSHAFSEFPMNLSYYNRRDLESSEKKIGLGAVPVTSTSPEEVWSQNKILNYVKEASERYGPENVAYLHPDCGLRKTPPSAAVKILKNLSEAWKVMAENE